MTTFEETKTLLSDSTFYYIICIGMDGKYSYVNNHYQSRFIYIHERLVGQPYHITMPELDGKTCIEVAAKCFANADKTFPATIRKHDGLGGFVITQWEYKAMFDDENQPAGIFCIGHDITEYINSSSELAGAKIEIEKKDNSLQEIAFNQSHVIRRPLANIMGLALILEKMEMDQNLRNICNMMMESSQQLDAVIKENMSKINSMY